MKKIMIALLSVVALSIIPMHATAGASESDEEVVSQCNSQIIKRLAKIESMVDEIVFEVLVGIVFILVIGGLILSILRIGVQYEILEEVEKIREHQKKEEE